MLALFINPLIVMFLLWLVARHDAELSYIKILLIMSVLTIVVVLIGAQHPLVALICYIVLLPIAITRFLYVSLPKAIIVTVLFLVWQVLFNVAFSYITRFPTPPTAESKLSHRSGDEAALSSPRSANRCHMCTQLRSPNRAAAADSSFGALYS